MNKTELVEIIAKKTGLSLIEAQNSVTGIIDSITSTLKDEGIVTLLGFGTFKTVKRAARMGINPKTQAAIEINETIAPKFRPGKLLKDVVAGKAAPENS